MTTRGLTYDDWKTHNPDDEWLGPPPDETPDAPPVARPLAHPRHIRHARTIPPQE